MDKLEATHIDKCIISTQQWKNEYIISWNNNIISPWRFITQESWWKNLNHAGRTYITSCTRMCLKLCDKTHIEFMIWRSTMGKEDKRKYAYKLGRFSEPPQSITLPKLLKIKSSEFRMFIWTGIRMFIWMELIMNINPEYIQK